MQAALVAALLVGTALLTISYIHFNTADLGFNKERVFLLPYSASTAGGGRTAEASSVLRSEIVRRLRQDPDIENVAITVGSAPLSGGGTMYSVRIPDVVGFEEKLIPTTMVTPGFFETLGMRLVRGRLFNDTDRRGESRVAVINEVAASEWFGANSPIDRAIDLNGPIRIVGVVKSVLPNGPDVPAQPAVYTVVDQEPLAAAMNFGTIVPGHSRVTAGRLRASVR